MQEDKNSNDKAETGALNKNAIVNSRPNKQIYTFTPLSLLQVTLQHAQTMQTALVLAPFLINRPWLCLLMRKVLGLLTVPAAN